jgi:hypothetical protein
LDHTIHVSCPYMFETCFAAQIEHFSSSLIEWLLLSKPRELFQ